MDSQRRLRVLVTYGSRREGTREIANAITDVLREHGMFVDCCSASFDSDVESYDAVIIGGALYMHRWHADARRFVTHHAAGLRARSVWLFSSGPLDLSSSDGVVPPTHQVHQLMKHVGARGHATFGGRLARDARGFPASSMARSMSGDFRDWDAIRAWANDVATRIEHAPAVDHRPIHEAARWPLALACAAAGIMALPHGTVSLAIGAGLLLESLLVLRRSTSADIGGVVTGGALAVWNLAPMIASGAAGRTQLGMLAIAAIVLGESIRRIAYRRVAYRSALLARRAT